MLCRPRSAAIRALWCLALLLSPSCPAVTLHHTGDVVALASDRTRVEFNLRTGLFDGYLLRGERFLKNARGWAALGGKQFSTTDPYRRYLKTSPVKDGVGEGREILIEHTELPGAPDLTLRIRMYDHHNLLLTRLEVTPPFGAEGVLERASPLDGVVNLSSNPEELRVLANTWTGAWYTDLQMPDLWQERRTWETRSHFMLGVANPETLQGVAAGALGTQTPTAVRFGFDPERDPRNGWLTALADYGQETAGGPSALRLAPGRKWASDWMALIVPKPVFSALEEYGSLFRKLNNLRFRAVPSGWCSWYSVGNTVSQDFVLRNADVVARELKPYGASLVQIDDGWQRGSRMSMDWSPNNRFPDGMAWLASQIRRRGLEPGLWIAPFGDEDEPKNRPDLLARDAAGRTTGGLDLSLPQAQQWLDQLTATVRQWGYTYVKADFLRAAADGPQGPPFHGLYRDAVARLKRGLGPRGTLLSCVAHEWKTAGVVDAQRVGGDVEASWRGILPAARLVPRRYFTHRNLWISDPDVVLLRPPLTLEQARAWATLAAFSGGSILAGDDLTQLPPERMDLLKRILPVFGRAARPLDLFDPAPGLGPRYPRIWDLPMATPGAGRHVLALFNWDTETPQRVVVDFSRVGWDGRRPVILYDFWGRKLLGEYRGRYEADLPPTSTLVLAAQPRLDRPFVLSTDRHVLQGAVELRRTRWRGSKGALEGQIQPAPDRATELVLYAGPRWKLLGARLGGKPARVARDGSLARLSVPAGRSFVSWLVRFARQRPPRATRPSVPAYRVSRGPGALPPAVGMDAAPTAAVDAGPLDLVATPPDWHEGSFDNEGPPLVREGTSLAVWAPVTLGYDLEDLRAELRPFASVDGAMPGTDPPSGFRTLRGSAAVGDRDVELLFEVLGDGRVLWQSGPLGRGRSTSFEVSVEGVRDLRLAVHKVRGWFSAARGRWTRLELVP